MYIVGELYNRRREIHALFGGQQQGGISTPSQFPYVFLFTGDQGQTFGYRDGWHSDGLYYYTGEGQVGDQELARGNKAILDHQKDGKELLLFQYEERRLVRFVGQMNCVGYHTAERPDREGNLRKVLVFELVPVKGVEARVAQELRSAALIEEEAKQLSLKEILDRVKPKEKTQATPIDRKKDYYERSEYLRIYALKRANGVCEGCGQPAPFLDKAGEPYLEVHNLRRLSDGGLEDPDQVVALCPTCHSRVHHGQDGKEFNEGLKRKERRGAFL